MFTYLIDFKTGLVTALAPGILAYMRSDKHLLGLALLESSLWEVSCPAKEGS